VLFVCLGIVLGVVLMAGARVLGPAWGRFDTGGTVASVRTWADARWSWFETGVNDVMDRIYIRYYDRRAPAEATPSPSPTAAPADKAARP
jgi:hypothetical protein